MKSTTTLAFTGDIGFDHYMQNKWEDEELIDPALLDILTSSDHVIANVEGPLAGEDAVRVKAAEMRLMHTIDPKAVVVLKKIHADIWNLANNHIMDVGPDGLAMTLEEAAKAGAQTIGAEMDLEKAKRPVILDEAGGIGMFGVGYQRGCKPAGPDKAGCLSWSDMDSIEEVIKGIKQKCRWCVVVAHGGEEFTAIPSPYTRDRYLAYLKMGADVVVSHHPSGTKPSSIPLATLFLTPTISARSSIRKKALFCSCTLQRTAGLSQPMVLRSTAQMSIFVRPNCPGSLSTCRKTNTTS